MLWLQFGFAQFALGTLNFFLRASRIELHDDGCFFAVFLRLFSASSSELRPCQLMTMVLWTYTHL